MLLVGENEKHEGESRDRCGDLRAVLSRKLLASGRVPSVRAKSPAREYWACEKAADVVGSADRGLTSGGVTGVCMIGGYAASWHILGTGEARGGWREPSLSSGAGTAIIKQQQPRGPGNVPAEEDKQAGGARGETKSRRNDQDSG